MAATMYTPRTSGKALRGSSPEWGSGNNLWDWVLMILISLIVVASLVGCSRTVLPSPSVTVKEKIVERIIKDTVTIQLPSERVEVVRRDSSILQTKIAITTAKILSDGSLLHTLENKPSLPVQIQYKEIVITKDSIVREPYAVPGKDVPVFKQHWYESLFMWIGIVLLSLIGLSALGRWAWKKV